MHSNCSRRVGASLIAHLRSTQCHSQACRTSSRSVAAAPHRQHVRPFSRTSQQWQQQAPQPTTRPSPVAARFATTSSSSTASPAPKPSGGAQNVTRVQSELSPADESSPQRSLNEGLSDELPTIFDQDDGQVDWGRSFHGLSSTPFSPEQGMILQQEIPFDDIEIKPDGIIYLPEIKYRRILNKTFGPGGWGLAPRGETIVTAKVVTREYGLVCSGRLVSIARGEQQYFDPDGIPTATEGCKSNALMRCCKDLGIASELWDPRFIKRFMAEMGRETIVEHMVTKKRRKHAMRKDDEIKYPFKEVVVPGSAAASTGATRR